MSHSETNLPGELREVADTLGADLPRMTEPEFARVRRTALARAMTRGRRSPAVFTRSRLTITSMLAVGALMSTGGAALGVSALSTDLTARAAQYGTPAAQSAPTLATPVAGSGVASATDSGGVASATDSGGEASAASSPRSDSEQAAEQAVATASATATAQAPRQLEAAGRSELPFTGYLAIPLLLTGLALLATGCVLRRSGRRAPAQT